MFETVANERASRLEALKLMLLQGKTWRYLRYIHARQALMLTENVRSVLVIGAGGGLAELALALEFPHMSFRLTDWEAASHDNSPARRLVTEWNIPNVTFSVLNILAPQSKEKYDLVYSVEVLEHIKDDSTAALNMSRLAHKYVFCMVPFAEEAHNQEPDRRAYAFKKFEHFLCGYNLPRLKTLFPNQIVCRGAYWTQKGSAFRQLVNELRPPIISELQTLLMSLARDDLVDAIPVLSKEAMGIWCLAHP